VESVTLEIFAVIVGYKNGDLKLNALPHFDCSFVQSDTINWKEHRLGSFERMVLRKISGPNWDD
jgi:hypothetical protein